MDHRIKIEFEDREALCSGICGVLAALPCDRWTASLSSLAQPTIDCLEQVTKTIDAHSSAAARSDKISALTRLADEIRLLSVIVRAFKNAAMKSKRETLSDGKPVAADANDPLISILRRPWPCLSHIASKYSSYEVSKHSLELLDSYILIGSLSLYF